MGVAYRKKGNLEQAIEMFDKALTIWRQTLDENSLEVAKCYADIGNVYQRQEIFLKALGYHIKWF